MRQLVSTLNANASESQASHFSHSGHGLLETGGVPSAEPRTNLWVDVNPPFCFNTSETREEARKKINKNHQRSAGLPKNIYNRLFYRLIG